MIAKKNWLTVEASVMVILIDTNVMLDYFMPRQPYADIAGDILSLCFERKCDGYVAAHSFTNIFYILRKRFSAGERKRLLLALCEFVEVAGIQRKQMIDALADENFDDFEDRLQVECAREVNADYIVTRNVSDFSASPVSAIVPEDFLQKIASR